MTMDTRAAKGAPLTWDEHDGIHAYLEALALSREAAGAASSSMSSHLAAVDPHPQYTTTGEAAAAAPVQSVMGRTGVVTLGSSDVTGALGFTPADAASRGQVNGLASLDNQGLVPAAQLPSYVDDVLEYANLAALPGTGMAGKIYVTLDTGRTYRWGGSAYTEIIASPGTTDAITEGSVNQYFTNARARAALSASQNLSYNATTGEFTGPDLTLYAPKASPEFTTTITVTGASPGATVASFKDSNDGVAQIRLMSAATGGNYSGSLAFTNANGSTEYASLRAAADNSAYFVIGGAVGMVLAGDRSSVKPGGDNLTSCGTGSNRWSTVYAASGTINTSDAREKTPVSPFSDAECNAARQLAYEIGTYRFLAAVADKGDAARKHVGMTVQRAIEIMSANGLDPMAYGFICHDQWDGGDRYSFRPDELNAFIAAGLALRLQGIEARLQALENR